MGVILIPTGAKPLLLVVMDDEDEFLKPSLIKVKVLAG